MKDRLFEIDVRLLVLRYGKQRVLDALARIDDETSENLEQYLHEARRKPKSSRTGTSKRSLSDVVASECRERPDIGEPLSAIARNFENRTFLPELRDVMRFLDRIGATSGVLKSRAAAGPVLIRALAKLPREELLKLTSRDKARESDYALLSRAIMGRHPSKSGGDD